MTLNQGVKISFIEIIIWFPIFKTLLNFHMPNVLNIIKYLNKSKTNIETCCIIKNN